MADSPPRRPLASPAAAAKWLAVMLLGVIAAGLLLEAGFGTAPARAQVAARTPGHLIAVAGKVTSETYGLYLLDEKNGTISVYQYVPARRKLRLMAVRNFRFDVQLDEYNTEPPVREIKDLVQKHKRLSTPE
jgi:hypothetical protein